MLRMPGGTDVAQQILRDETWVFHPCRGRVNQPGNDDLKLSRTESKSLIDFNFSTSVLNPVILMSLHVL